MRNRFSSRAAHIAGALAVAAWSYSAFAALPEEYQQVEWIRANGTQRMNLQYWHSPTTRVEMVCIIPTGGNYWSCLFGSRNSGCGANSFYFSSHFWGTSKPMWSLTGSETQAGTTSYFYGQKIKLRLDSTTKYCCWTNELNEGAGFYSTGTPTVGKCAWTLFELNKATTKDGVTWDGHKSSATIYTFKVWDGPTLSCNFKPCYRKSDHHVGLYDLQRGLFIENLLNDSAPLACGNPFTDDFQIGDVADQRVDGVNPCVPTPPVVKSQDGEPLVEGTDYILDWPDLARPGNTILYVRGKAGTAYAGLVGAKAFKITLAADAKKRPYLPEGYVELDGIYGAGPQYLTSGRTHTATTRVECDLMAPSAANSGYSAVFGYRNGNYLKNAMVFFAGFPNNNAACYNRTGKETGGAKFSWDTRTYIVAEGATATWTTATTTNSITTPGTLDDGAGSMYVFRQNGGSDDTAMTLYSYKMFEGDTCVCYLVPCYRVSDGVIGALDVTQGHEGNQDFRTNLGSGAFTKGNVLYRPTSTDTNLDFYVGLVEADSIGFGWSVNDAALVGGTLTAEWSSVSDFTTSVATNLGAVTTPYVNFDATAAGLAASTKYYFRATLAKSGRTDVVRTFGATTRDGAGAIDGTIARSWTSGQDPVFTGTVTVFGSGDIHRAKLCFSMDGENYDIAGTTEIASAGSFTVSGAWPTYYQKVWYKIVYENGTDGNLKSCETPAVEYTPTYTATYTWKASVTEGDWNDENNWTISACAAKNPTERYPRREAYHDVAFPASSATCVIRLTEDMSCRYFTPLRNARARVVGVGATKPKLTLGRINVCWNNFHLTLDRLDCTWTDTAAGGGGGDSGWYDCMGSGTCVRLQGGTTLNKTGSLIAMLLRYSNARIEVADGSYYNLDKGSDMIAWGPGTELLVDNARFRCGVVFRMNNGGTAPTYRFTGAAPQMEFAGATTVADTGGIALTFDPPTQGFTNVALKVTNGSVFLNGASGMATVSVDPKAPIWRSPQASVSPLIYDAKGIATNKVVLTPPKRASGTFVWQTTEGVVNPTGLSFVYRPTGMLLRLR